MPSGLSSIWIEMNGINDNNSLELLEFARFRRTTPDELAYFNDHADRHKSYYVNGKEFIMTPEEYDDNADSLSSFPGIPIGTGTDEDVVGYISQDGKKVKFIEIPGGAFMVAYIGDDVSGIARTFYYADINELLFKANPYHKILDGEKDHRYKSDLDGGFVGLDFFKPVHGGRRGVTEEEVEIIRDDILNDREISIK